MNPSNPAVAYVATAGGGIYKTIDGGGSWFRAGDLLTTDSPSPIPLWDVQAIAIDPASPSTLWAGASSRLFRSTDGGATWTFVWSSPNQSVGGPIWTITVDPGTPTRIYVGKSERVVRSIDGGASWHQIYQLPFQANGRVSAVVIDPTNRDVLYLGVHGWSPSKSINGGAAWTSLSIPAQFFAVDPVQSQNVYAGTWGSDGFRKSVDGGANWSVIGAGVVPPVLRAIAIDPASPATLYVATEGGGLFKSIDGGANWGAAGKGLTTPFLQTFALTPGRILLGTSGGGVFVSTNAAASWAPRNSGLIATAVQTLTSSAGTLFAGIYGLGISRTHLSGKGWTTSSDGLAFPAFYDLTVAPSNPSILFAASWEGIFKSVDGGITWARTILAENGGAEAVAVHPTNPSVVYAATYGSSGASVFRSSNGGDTWTPVNSGLVPTGSYFRVLSLAVDPVSSETLYAGTSEGVYKTFSGGQSWFPANSGATSQIDSVLIDPSNPQTVYGSNTAGIYKTTNGGASWSLVHEVSSGAAFAINPSRPNELLAGGFWGVRRSADGGATWENLGLTNREVTSFAFDSTNPSRVFAGIAAGGVFSLDVPAPAAFFTLTPCRLADTRDPAFESNGVPALAAGAVRTFGGAGRCGIPTTARSVALNLTVVPSDSAGYLTAYPGGAPLPLASTINYKAGQVRANNAIVPLGSGGTLAIFCGQGSGTTHVIIDVVGYFE